MRLIIGTVLVFAAIGTAQSPTFTKKEVGQAFLCGKMFGLLSMGITDEKAEIGLKLKYIDSDCLRFQDIGEDRPWKSAAHAMDYTFDVGNGVRK